MGLLRKMKEKGLEGTLQSVRSRVARWPLQLMMPHKLKTLLSARERQLAQGFGILEIRSKTLDFIESMRINDVPYGRYKYSPSQSEPVLYASLYALLTRHLYRDLNQLTTVQKYEWAHYIKSFQDDDGWFRDPAINNELAGTVEWWGWMHMTFHAIMALSCLGECVSKKFKFLDSFKSKEFINEWFHKLEILLDPSPKMNVHQPLYMMTFLQYVRDFQNEKWAAEPIRAIYEKLDNLQDAKTGCWATSNGNSELVNEGVKIGYHLWIFYFYDRRPIQYLDRVIDSCLATQNELGGFDVSKNSSACDDIDTIDPLCRLSFMTDYKNEEILLALKKAIPWILVNMNSDGGFVFKRMEPFIYGHEKMSSYSNESAMFPTWFRTLSLAYIAQCLPESSLGRFDWNFVKCPGLQFWMS